MSRKKDVGLPTGRVGEFWSRSKRQGRQRLKRSKRGEWRELERSEGEKMWPYLVRMNHELGE